MSENWEITVSKADFVDAVNVARTRATLRSKGGISVESEVTLTACPEGLSVRSSFAATDIDAEGVWPSPVMVHGATLRKIAPKLQGEEITLSYEPGRLKLNGTLLTARDV